MMLFYIFMGMMAITGAILYFAIRVEHYFGPRKKITDRK